MGTFKDAKRPDAEAARQHAARHPEWFSRRGDTAEYPSVVEPARPRVPTWAIVVMTLAVLVSLVGYPLAAWRYWHG